MPVGSELREAREAAGLSAEEVGDRTNIQSQKIEALENDQFDGLPEGIYLDGIIRAYAHEVGIDADPLIKRARVERAKFAATPEAAQEALDMFPPEEAPTPPASPPPPDPVLPRVSVPRPVPPQLVSAPPSVAAIPAVSKPPPAPSPLPITRVLDDSLYDIPPLPSSVDPPPVLPPTRKARPAPPVRRRRGFALPLMTMLAIAGWAAAFYEANRQGTDRVSVADAVADAVTPATRTEKPEETRAAAPSVTEPPPTTDASPSTSRRETPGVAGTAGIERVSPETAPPVERLNQSNEPAAATVRGVNVSGGWAMAAQVERSGDASLEGDVVGYEIQLQQAGTRISGNGRRISENGEPIGAADQTPISLSGTIQGDRMTLTFTQAGSRPMSQGKLVLVVDRGSGMQGRFSSADAQSSGSVEARRMP